MAGKARLDALTAGREVVRAVLATIDDAQALNRVHPDRFDSQRIPACVQSPKPGIPISLTIQLPIEDKARLAMKAKHAGVDLPTYVERVLKAELTRPPLDEILKPVQDAFVESGMSEDDLSELLVKAKKDMRGERQSRGRA